jgi:hypothetical protein
MEISVKEAKAKSNDLPNEAENKKRFCCSGQKERWLVLLRRKSSRVMSPYVYRFTHYE